MNNPLPTITAAKAQAKRLRTSLQTNDMTISHGKALEMVAEQHGFRDWNTLHAAIGNTGPAALVQVGQKVTGLYLGHPFSARVIGVRSMAEGTIHRVTLRFDQPVNVSKFASMDVLRRQVSANLDRHGVTAEKTSDGQPHMVLHL